MKKIIKEVLFIYIVSFFYFGGFIFLFSKYLTFKSPFFLQLLGIILGFSGLSIWAIGFFSLGKNFNILPKPIGFTSSGIYGIFRHPIYLGISLTFFGFSLTFGSFFGIIYSVFILGGFNFFRAKKEEKLLKEKCPQNHG